MDTGECHVIGSEIIEIESGMLSKRWVNLAQRGSFTKEPNCQWERKYALYFLLSLVIIPILGGIFRKYEITVKTSTQHINSKMYIYISQFDAYRLEEKLTPDRHFDSYNQGSKWGFSKYFIFYLERSALHLDLIMLGSLEVRHE